MKIIYKKQILGTYPESDAAFLVRELRRNGCRVRYDDKSVTLQGAKSLEVAKATFWDL
jgi:hypothetical protein